MMHRRTLVGYGVGSCRPFDMQYGHVGHVHHWTAGRRSCRTSSTRVTGRDSIIYKSWPSGSTSRPRRQTLSDSIAGWS